MPLCTWSDWAGAGGRAGPGRRATGARPPLGGEQGPQLVECLDVRDRIGPGRAADRSLVDEHDVADRFPPLQGAHRADRLPQMVLGAVYPPQPGRQLAVQHVVDQRGLARSGHARDRGERAQGDPHVHVLEVVQPGAAEREPAARRPSRRGHADALLAGEVLAGERTRVAHPRRGPLVHQSAARPRAPAPPTRRAPPPAGGPPPPPTPVSPAPGSRRNRASSRPVSAGWRPIVGSSSTYRVSTRWAPRALESAMRCASPPESVRVRRSRVRYPRPTSFTNETRAPSSARMWTATARWKSLSARPAIQSRNAPAVSADTSAMFLPPTRPASASGLSRAPPQAGQVLASWYCRRNTRMYCL